MTAQLSVSDYQRVAQAISNGATVDAAALLVGVTGRTIFRRMKVDGAASALIRDAIAEREAARERVPHGTPSRYSHGCRCPLCREAATQYMAKHRFQRRSRPIPDFVVHGKAATYSNWHCRCDSCSSAHSERCAAAYNDRKRAVRLAAK